MFMTTAPAQRRIQPPYPNKSPNDTRTFNPHAVSGTAMLLLPTYHGCPGRPSLPGT